MQDFSKISQSTQKHLGGVSPHSHHIIVYLYQRFTFLRLFIYRVFTWTLQPAKQSS